MLKFLIVFSLISYLFIKLGGFILKVLFGSIQTRSNYQQTHYEEKKYKDGIKINVMRADKKKNKSNFEGGDYVNYEEVK